MKELDKLVDENSKPLFLTDDGLIFEDEIGDLIADISKASFIKITETMEKISDTLLSIEEMKKEKEKIQKSDKLSNETKEEAIAILVEIEQKLVVINSSMTEIADLLAKYHSLANNNRDGSPASVNKNGETNEESIIVSSKILERLFACLVLSMYTYMEVYCLSTLQSIICYSSPERLYDIYDRLKNAKDPLKSSMVILRCISVLGDQESNLLSCIVDQCIKNSPIWKNRKLAFEKFLKLRNKVAHRDPSVEISFLISSFYELTNKMSDNIDDFDKQMEDMLAQSPIMISYAEEMLKSFFQIFRHIIVISTIGQESMMFLAFLDRLVHKFLKEENCLETESNEEV